MGISGSSPRLWGTPRAVHGRADPDRFIPTPVGNTSAGMPAALQASVHPHACGEHSWRLRRSASIGGSPPRLWGTPQKKKRFPLHPRFIPTPVGNTVQEGVPDSPTSVHPHACGEHNSSSRYPSINSGSSPRLWGTHFQQPLVTLFNFQRTNFHQTIYRFSPSPSGGAFG